MSTVEIGAGLYGWTAQSYTWLPEDGGVARSKQVMALAGALLVLLLGLAVIAALVYLIVRMAGKRERLVSLAIEKNQSDVAKALIERKGNWGRWILAAFVGIVVLSWLPGWGVALVLVVLIITVKQWWPVVTGKAKKNRRADAAEGTAQSGAEDKNVPDSNHIE